MENEDFQSIFTSVINNIEEKLRFSKTGKRKANSTTCEGYKNLIINYLPAEIDEENLKTLFGLIGEVDKVHIMRKLTNNGPGKSFGYGFVDYVNASDGEKAVELLNGTKILNKTIKVSFSRPSANDTKLTNIYVSGLPQSFTQKDLEDLYSNFGTIVSSIIIQNQDEIGRNIAFVRFEKREQANNAIIATNNCTPKGCTNSIQVRFSNTSNTKNIDIMKRRKLGDLNEFSGQDGDFQIYVNNLNSETNDNTLWKLFGAFGAIKNTKAVTDLSTNKCKGFGFVTMKHLDEAVQAVQTLNGYTHDNRVLQVSFKNKSRNGEVETKGLNLTEVTGKYTLYIYNINPASEDTAIWKLFGQFGAVKNVKVIREAAGTKSKGFGFVTMKNIDEAAEAVRVLNGFTLDNRVLQVSFKTNKNSESLKDINIHEVLNNDIPSHIATDRFGSVQIFVYNLAKETEEKHLWKLFGQFGAVKNVKVIEDKIAKYEYKGHAFVSMKDYKEASLAVGALNGILLDERILQVSFKIKANNN